MYVRSYIASKAKQVAIIMALLTMTALSANADINMSETPHLPHISSSLKELLETMLASPSEAELTRPTATQNLERYNKFLEIMRLNSALKLALEEFYSQYNQTSEKQNEDRVNSIRTQALNLALLLIESRRPQEAIWVLEHGFMFSHAEYVSQRLIAFMNSEIQVQDIERRLRERSRYETEPIVFEASNGLLFDIRKTLYNEFHKISSDVWAYKLDRALGLNMVPVSVMVNGTNRPILIQLRVGGTPIEHNFKNDPYKAEQSTLYTLDFLLRHQDRKSTNARISSLGNTVATGNSLAFHGHRTYSNRLLRPLSMERYWPAANPHPVVMASIVRATDRSVDDELTGYANPEVREFILERIKRVRAMLKETQTPLIVRPIRTAERLAQKDGQTLEVIKDAKLNTSCQQFFGKIREHAYSYTKPSIDVSGF